MAKIIVESFGSQIANGMAVYDVDGNKIGAVLQVDLTNGWFQSEKGVFFPRDRYIPFSAIDRVGPSGIYLTVTKDYVKDMYDQPPMVDVDVVAGPNGAAALGTVRSGYDGSRVLVNSTTLSQAIARLDNGLKVYDANGAKVGRVYQYVPGSAWIVVEKGAFSTSDLYIPVTAIDYLDGDGVFLRVPKDVLKDAFAVRPADLTVDVVATPDGAVAMATMADDADGDRVLIDSTNIGLVVDHLGRGPKVFDSDGKEIGRVTEYDPAGGWMQVEKGVLFPKDLYIPVTAVAYLAGDGIYLRLPQAVLKDAFVVPPANITFVAAVA
jgi:hypothetical protein